MAFTGILIALCGFTAVMAGGSDYYQPSYQPSYPAAPYYQPSYQPTYSYEKKYTLEYPEYRCETVYKATAYTAPSYNKDSYGYSKDYSYKQETYYTLYPEIVCREIKKANEYQEYYPKYEQKSYY